MLTLTSKRLSRGWSKAELARRAEIDQGTMSKIELKRLVPYPAQLKRLARVLRVPAETLLDEIEESAVA